MTRFFAFLLAMIVSTAAITSACAADARYRDFNFTLTSDGGAGQVQARFQPAGLANQSWSSNFLASQLAGFDEPAFRASGSHALRFAVDRETGRLGCAGAGGSARASGTCSFAPSAAFSQRLAANGIAQPNYEGWFGLFALDVRSDLLAAVKASGYPAPTVEQLMEMTAVGVSGEYIRALAHYGYRPRSIDDLVEFKAVGVDPAWIGGLAAAGYAGIPSDQIVELRALDVDGPYIRSFQAAGYGHLDADDLVQMKALGVTAEFARRVESAFGRQSPEKLVELKAVGFDPARR